jgi:hypothetical protein
MPRSAADPRIREGRLGHKQAYSRLTSGSALARRGDAVIKELTDMPAGVIGFEATGKLQAEDYRDVVLPALERAAATGEIRFLMVMPEFGGITGGALWQDLKVGVEHLRKWKRIALVTDIEWMIRLTDLFGWMTPGEVKTFPVTKRDDAIAWVAG